MTRQLSYLDERKKDVYCAAFVAALAVLFLYKVVFLGKVLLPADVLLRMSPWKYYSVEKFPEFHKAYNPMLDVIQQYYPWRQFAAEWIRRGTLPFWNPYMFSGAPFVANGQSAIFYPFNFLFYVMPVKYAFGWTALLHLLLIGLSSYGFFKLVHRHRLAALVGAIVFMFCGFITSWLEFTTFLCTATWLPVTLYLFERAISREGQDASSDSPGLFHRSLASDMALPGVALGLALLAGHLQIGFYVWLTFLAYAVYRIGLKPLTRFVRLVPSLSVAGLVGLGIGAPQWLPVIELTRYSTRSGPFDFNSVWILRLPVKHLLTFLIPNFFGNPVDYNYWGSLNFNELSGSLGVMALLFWVPAVWSKDRGRARFWTALLLLSFAVSMVTPLYWIFVWCIPGFAQLRGPARALLIADFAGAALASQGIQVLLEQGPQLGKRIFTTGAGAAFLLIVAVMVGVLVFSMDFLSDSFVAYGLQQIIIFLIFLIIGVYCMFLLSKDEAVERKRAPSRHRFAPRGVAVLLPATVALECFVATARFNPAVDPSMVYFDTESIQFLHRDKSLYRVLCLGTNFLHWMPSNAPMAMGLEDVQGSDSLWSGEYNRYLQSVEPGAPRWDWKNYRSPDLDDLNVKYILTPPDMKLDPPPGRLVFNGDMKIYQREHPRPRFWLDSGESVEVKPENPDLMMVRVNVRKDRPVETEPSQPHPLSRAPAHELSWSEPFYPGWRVWVDGKPRPLTPRGSVMSSVSLGPDDHEVDFVFLPTTILFGMFVLCAAVGICVGLWSYRMAVNRNCNR